MKTRFFAIVFIIVVVASLDLTACAPAKPALVSGGLRSAARAATFIFMCRDAATGKTLVSVEIDRYETLADGRTVRLWDGAESADLAVPTGMECDVTTVSRP